MLHPKILSRPLHFLAVSALIVLIAIPASGVVNHKLLRAEERDPLRSLVMYDLAGIAYFSNDPSVFWDGPFTKQVIADCYTPERWDSLGYYTHNKECSIFWATPSPHKVRTWIVAIIKHPLAYAEHRLVHFNFELAFVPAHNTPKAEDVLMLMPMFTPSFALAMGLLVLFLTFPRPSTQQSRLQAATICLVTSGLLYMGAYVIVGVSNEQRYQYWDMIAVFVAAVICFSERRAGRALSVTAARTGTI